MKRDTHDPDIPIQSAVIAWQPAFLQRNDGDAGEGSVAVLPIFDPAALAYAMTHGACWCDWAEQSVPELLDALEWLKSILAEDYGIALRSIEAAFAVIPEYRSR